MLEKEEKRAGEEGLSLKNVTLERGGHKLLFQENFCLPLEGIILLRGRNGAGKTSFLHALLGLVPLRNGFLTLWGKSPAQIRSSIGFMPQHGAGEAAPMIPVLSHVIATLEGEKWGIPLFSKRKEKARHLLALVGAEQLAMRPWGKLSGGERQRVSLAQALASALTISPSLLILDEPLAALDSVARRDILALLQQLYKKFGLTILMTVHEEMLIKDYFPFFREIWLEDGHIIEKSPF